MSYSQTKTIVKQIARHGEAAEQELEELLLDKSLTVKDIAIEAALEQDFGVNYRHKIKNLSDDAMEAIITQGTFNKMIPKIIRAALAETPKEEYKLSRLAFNDTVGECDGPVEDHGVFSDFQAHEVCELEMGPLYGVATDFQRHPMGKQASNGIAWTREALCRDPNRFLQQQIPKLRDSLDEWKENKLIDTFIGYLPTYDRSGTLYDTYYAADGSSTPFDDGSGGPWVNAAEFEFGCASDLTTIKELFWDMTDLVHGREIVQDIDRLSVMTSKQEADRIRPLLMASAIETDYQCAVGANTSKYIMSTEVANGISFDVTAYSRLIDRIVLRYGISRTKAQAWMFAGFPSEFIAWASQIAPQVNRCTLGAEECRKRIVAVYSTLVKGYAYIRDPHKMVVLTDTLGASS